MGRPDHSYQVGGGRITISYVTAFLVDIGQVEKLEGMRPGMMIPGENGNKVQRARRPLGPDASQQ